MNFAEDEQHVKSHLFMHYFFLSALFVTLNLFASFTTKAQYFEKNQQQSDSLWTAVNNEEKNYKEQIKKRRYHVSATGKRINLKGYNEEGVLVYHEKVRFFKSGIARRKISGYRSFSNPTSENRNGDKDRSFIKPKLQTFHLRSYGDTISYAMARNGENKLIFRVLDNSRID